MRWTGQPGVNLLVQYSAGWWVANRDALRNADVRTAARIVVMAALLPQASRKSPTNALNSAGFSACNQ